MLYRNHASDKTLRKTIIEIKGSYDGGEPLVVWNNSNDGRGKNNRTYKVKSNYDTNTQVLRLEIEHNGIVDFDVTLDDSGKEYDVLRRGAVDDIYSETNADITKLQQLTEQKVEDSHNYTYFRDRKSVV